MEHQAFVFDYERYESELSRTLYEALRGGSLEELTDFIARHWSRLRDGEGEPLSSGWHSLVDPQDAHQYGDLALTKFYDPCANIGLGYDWEPLVQALERSSASSAIVLGTPFGPPENPFDPGKMGSYFCSARNAEANHTKLRELQKALGTCGERAIQMFHAAIATGKGLYATF